MSSAPTIPFSLKRGEALTLGLGLGTTALLVTIRLWTKLRLIGRTLAEDYISLVAFLAYAGGFSSLKIMVDHEYGKDAREAYIYTFADYVLYGIIVPLIKVSILLQYKSIFVMRRGEFMHTLVHGLIYTTVICYTFIIVVTSVLYGQNECLKDKKFNAICYARERTILLASGWFNVGSDVTILLLPLRPICHLQVPWSSKIRIAAIFGLGIFACAASAYRAYKCMVLLNQTHVISTRELDIDAISMWSSAEIATGIIVGCLPVLPRFIREYAPGHRISSPTDHCRKPSFFTKLCTRIANFKGLRKDLKTRGSHNETPDPRLHSLQFNLPHTPAQTYNNPSIRTSQTFSSCEGRNDHRVDEQNQSYIRLDDVERGENVCKGSSIGPGTLSL